MSYTFRVLKIKKNVPKTEIGCKGTNNFLIYKRKRQEKCIFLFFLCISMFFCTFVANYELRFVA